MNPWITLYTRWLNMLNGDVDVNQMIAPFQYMMSPHYEITIKGDKKTETRVIQEVASYGDQLGQISKAVLDLVDNKNESVNFDTLRETMKHIDKIKKEQRKSNLKELEDTLFHLKQNHPDEYKELIHTVNEKNSSNMIKLGNRDHSK